MANKRNLFDELRDGVATMKTHRSGKITLRSYKVEARPPRGQTENEQAGPRPLPLLAQRLRSQTLH